MLILQTGSIEISNINVNDAVMDTKKDIGVYKEEWFNQVEEDSKNLFKVAEDAIKKKPDLEVIIVKRLPRFDRSSQDIIGVKSKLSSYANAVYDQLWLKRGSPSNIQIEIITLVAKSMLVIFIQIVHRPNSSSKYQRRKTLFRCCER